MVEQEDREVMPHQEEMEVINLGVGRESKEVKVGTGMSTNVRDELVALLRVTKTSSLSPTKTCLV